MTIRPRILVGILVALGLVLFAVANSHLVYVAVKSQPECVEHQKPGAGHDGTSGFSAAKSAC
ncbi:MAG TPA: hypothetical protein VIK87_03880 [Sphingomonadales bacterium]